MEKEIKEIHEISSLEDMKLFLTSTYTPLKEKVSSLETALEEEITSISM